MKRPIKKSVQALLVTASMAPLLACSPEIGIGPSFFQEAGTQLDPGNFGNATLHNQLVQTCRTNAGYKSGGKAGGAAGDPVVVLDPSSSANRPVYRVHCDGLLLRIALAAFLYCCSSPEPTEASVAVAVDAHRHPLISYLFR